MRMYDLIYSKKLGGALSAEEISFWVKGASDGSLSLIHISEPTRPY